MYIQSRVYKYNSSKKEVRDKISRLGDHSTLSGKWVDDTIFCLKKKPFGLFTLLGKTDEIESNHKLKIAFNVGYWYPLLYILPVAIITYGAFQFSKDEEKGWVVVLAGVFLFGLIFLITSALIEGLKKSFKEEFQII